MKKTIKTSNAPGAVGPYNQAVVSEKSGLVFVSGQLGFDPETGDFVPGGIEQQTRQVLKNLEQVLMAAGSGLMYVLKTTVFLKNMDDFAAMNAVYAEFFPEEQPARAAVQVARLPKDAIVEIEAVAELAD